MLCLVTAAIAVRLPGVFWLIGYGHESDYSFHPDDNRFIIFAKNFHDPFAKPGDGYLLFMPTQLFMLNLFLHKIVHIEVNSVIVLRCISMAYAILSIILSYVFLISLGFSRFVSILSSFFLAFAPLHIILSHFGTPDMSVFFLFYSLVFAAWRYRMSNKEFWFYMTLALAGITMADKFFLPALVPPTIIVFNQPADKIWQTSFISLCVIVTFFCGASFFNFTPWDLLQLLRLLTFDNLLITGGKSPLQQIILYPWDIIACSGAITSGLALIGCILLFHRSGFSRLYGFIDELRRKKITLSTIVTQMKIWIRLPVSVIILPLLFHAVLIVMAQVHFSRHILIFVPIVCVLAALAIETVRERFRFKSIPLQVLGAVVLYTMLTIQFANGLATDWIYPTDIRAKLGDFLTEGQLADKTSTFSGFTYLRDVSVTHNIPETPIFISCDIEYRRYILAGQGIPVVHLFGGKIRTDFFISLLTGQTNYVTVFDIKRNRLGVEDYLAEKGWLPNIDTYVPNECRAFQKKGS